jgi:hypothetical protein
LLKFTEAHKGFSRSCVIHTVSDVRIYREKKTPGLAHILWLLHLASHRPQVAVQSTSKELQQHLEADAGESWVVAAPVMLSVFETLHPTCPRKAGWYILRQLIADESMLGPGGLVERECHAGVVEGFADEVAALGRDVGVFFAEDLSGVVSRIV